MHCWRYFPPPIIAFPCAPSWVWVCLLNNEESCGGSADSAQCKASPTPGQKPAAEPRARVVRKAPPPAPTVILLQGPVTRIPTQVAPVQCSAWAQLLPGGACAVVTRVRHVVPSLLAVSPGGAPGWPSSILLLQGLPSTPLASEPEAAGVMQYCSHACSVNHSGLRLYFKRVQKGRGISAIGAMLWP